jgi:hypothetical protein
LNFHFFYNKKYKNIYLFYFNYIYIYIYLYFLFYFNAITHYLKKKKEWLGLCFFTCSSPTWYLVINNTWTRYISRKDMSLHEIIGQCHVYYYIFFWFRVYNWVDVENFDLREIMSIIEWYKVTLIRPSNYWQIK